MNTQIQRVDIPTHQASQAPGTYETAKAERDAYVIDWMGETVMAEPACSGWARSALLLVINHSLISEEEKEAEKACLNQYNNNQAYHRRMYWQSTIEVRESKMRA